MDRPSVLTVDDLARELRISKGAAYRLANSKALRVIRIGRTIRIPRSALEAYLNGGGASA